MRKPQPAHRLHPLLRSAIRVLVAIGLTGFFGPGSFGQTTATYDENTRYLTLPSVKAIGATYRNVVIRLDSVTVISIGAAAPTPISLSSSVTYDAGTRYLTLPSVLAMGITYYGLVARLDGFELISVDPPEPSTPSTGYDYGGY